MQLVSSRIWTRVAVSISYDDNHYTIIFIIIIISRSSCIYIIIDITSSEVFTSLLADGLSLEFKREQVSSMLQDSSQYSGRSQ